MISERRKPKKPRKPPRLEMKKFLIARKIVGNALLSHSPLPKFRRTSSSTAAVPVFRSDGGLAVPPAGGFGSGSGVAVDGSTGGVTAGGSGDGIRMGGSVGGGFSPLGGFVPGADVGA